jgi:hypothetical protein
MGCTSSTRRSRRRGACRRCARARPDQSLWAQPGRHLRRDCAALPTSVPALGSPLPTSVPALGSALPTSVLALGSPLPTPVLALGSPLPTSEPGLGSPTPATSGPRLGLPLPTSVTGLQLKVALSSIDDEIDAVAAQALVFLRCALGRSMLHPCCTLLHPCCTPIAPVAPVAPLYTSCNMLHRCPAFAGRDADRHICSGTRRAGSRRRRAGRKSRRRRAARAGGGGASSRRAMLRPRRRHAPMCAQAISEGPTEEPTEEPLQRQASVTPAQSKVRAWEGPFRRLPGSL